MRPAAAGKRVHPGPKAAVLASTRYAVLGHSSRVSHQNVRRSQPFTRISALTAFFRCPRLRE